MKHTHKHNAGFTLVELVVAIAMATIVTAAATSVLLMGLRINRQTADTASQQITVRSLLDVMEDTASDGSIKGVISDYNSWQLLDAKIEKDDQGNLKTTGRIIFGFDSESQMIYSNGTMEYGAITSKGTTILEGVFASTAMYENSLLTIAVETKEGSYSSSVNCRLAPSTFGNTIGDATDTEGVITSDAARLAFLDILKSQYRSRGEIKGTNTYYSQWYLGGEYSNGWNSKTPWCACYVSWALNEMGAYVNQPESRKDTDKTGNAYYKWFANVDEFILYFTTEKYGANGQSWYNRGSRTPESGDVIFFDWDRGTDPEHVGVVLSVDTTRNIVYTIEGNSAGRVTIRSYSLSDTRIIGYGVLF